MPIVLLSTADSASDQSLQAHRRAAAPELGPFRVSTATGGSALHLLDARWPVKNAAEVSDVYVDQYVYRPVATTSDRDRGVSSYDPTTGQLAVDTAYSVAPAYGESYELLGLLPGTTINELVNEALKRIPLVVEFSFNPPADTNHISLATAASWLTNETWVRQVGALGAGLDRTAYRPSRVSGEAVRDGTVVYLDTDTTFNATDTLYVLAVKPAYYHCRPAGGTWGAQSGLVLETDEAVPVTKLVAHGVAVEAWRRFAKLLEPGANSRLIRNQAEAAALFSDEARAFFKAPDLTFRRIRTWGPAL